ncbi:MAG: radical SAM protein [Planctomycetota bacterium]
MRFEGRVFRPPSEADSLLLQVTIGCSHNECSFCDMYREKTFRVRPESEVFEDIALARSVHGEHGVRRAFLCDGDAFSLSTRRLTSILGGLKDAFPSLSRVGSYANARDVAAKSDEELCRLRELGLGILYMGLESGDESVLESIDKGATAQEIVTAVRRVQAQGIKASVMVLLGIAGRDPELRHARETARVLNRMQPRFVSLLTVTAVPGTPLARQIERGRFEPIAAEESLLEAREIVKGLDLEGSIFRCNHASNYLPLGGRLPADRSVILAQIDAALEGTVPLRPEWLRGF